MSDTGKHWRGSCDIEAIGLEVDAAPLINFDVKALIEYPEDDNARRVGILPLAPSGELYFEIENTDGSPTGVKLTYVNLFQGEEKIISSIHAHFVEGMWCIYHRKTMNEFRGKGIFKALYQLWEAYVLMHQRKVRVEVDTGQLAVVKAFERLGFRSERPSSELETMIASGAIVEDEGESPYLKSKKGDPLGRHDVRLKLQKTLRRTQASLAT